MKHDMHYRQPFWKLALGGILAGAALYFFPFLIPTLALLFLTGLMFRMILGSGHRHRHQMRHAFAARWQNMTEEQRQAMRMRSNGRGCGPMHRSNEHPSRPNI